MKKILCICCAILLCACQVTQSTKPEETNQVKYALGDILVHQREMDQEIAGYMQDASFTFDNPKVLLNPYGLTPLSALLIFQTEKETSIAVSINEAFQFTCEKATSHAIPIYGLYDNYENKILVINEEGKTNTITIQTEEFPGDRLRVEVSKVDALDDRLYFLSPNFVENCIYDKEGRLVWYITGDYAGDIEFLENGHFLISDPNQGTSGVKINYSSFLEMDYLGKIYKQWIPEYGYHHEIVQMDPDTFFTTGAIDNCPFLEAVLYTFDKNTGKTKYFIDMYEKLHNMAPAWVESLGGPFDFVLNSIDYNPDTKEVLLSFRGIGVIACMDYDTQEFKWMFGDPKNLPKEFEPYLLTVLDETKYPYGEHSAFFTKEGNVSFHNNDADQFHMQSDKLSDYLDCYTTNVVIDIDEEARTVKTIWEYDADKKEFSKVGGLFTFLENGNALINYGWSITQNAYENPEKISINDANYMNGIVLELNTEKEILFKGVMDGLIFRSYKMNFYPEKIPNYTIESYQKIDGTKKDYAVMDATKTKTMIQNPKEFEGNLDVFVNRMIVEMDYNEEDLIEVLFVNEKEESYLYTYKKQGELPPVFNSGRYGPVISIPEGEYHGYVMINGTCFDTNTTYVFE